MPEPQAVASRYADRRQLWKAAIKWPMYSVAVMPVLLAAGSQFGRSGTLRWSQLLGFLLAAILLLLWENLSNDLFDAETGVDATGKPHSVVNLTGRSDRVAQWSLVALGLGLVLMIGLAWSSSAAVFGLVLLCCGLGYVYQGPPFRLGYRGLGEPLCWLAFGPCATAAALLVLQPQEAASVPWGQAWQLGAGPALATTLVLFLLQLPSGGGGCGPRQTFARGASGHRQGRRSDPLVHRHHPGPGVDAGAAWRLAPVGSAQRCGAPRRAGSDPFDPALP